MKTTIKILSLVIFLFMNMKTFAQVNIAIQSLQYMNNGQSTVTPPNCGNIDLATSTSTSINLGINLSRPNGQTTGPSNLYVYTQKSPSDTRLQKNVVLVQDSNWNHPSSGDDTFSSSANFTIYSADFNVSGGTLFVVFKTDGGTETSSCSYTISKTQVPTFTLIPPTVSISCGSTDPVTFQVLNVYSSPGTRDHIWTIGSGWKLTDGSVAPSTYSTATVPNLTLVPNANPPGNVSVVPKLNGVSYPMQTSVVSRGGFNPSLTITGSASLCTTATYSISNLPTGITVTDWSSTNTSVATVSFNGNQATLTAVGNGVVTIRATVMNSCGQSKIVSRSDIIVGRATVSNHTILGGYDNQSVNSVTPFSVSLASGATQYYWEILTISSNCSSGTAKPKFNASNSTTYLTNLPYATVVWNQCPGSYIVQCWARNGCGDTPIGSKVITVFDQNSNPCSRSNVTEGKFELKHNPIKDGTIILNIYPPIDPCNTLAKGSALEVKNIVTLFDSYGKPIYSKAYRENDITIQGLKLNSGFYVLEVVSGSFQKRKLLIVK